MPADWLDMETHYYILHIPFATLILADSSTPRAKLSRAYRMMPRAETETYSKTSLMPLKYRSAKYNQQSILIRKQPRDFPGD
jgi:hypothetical protein